MLIMGNMSIATYPLTFTTPELAGTDLDQFIGIGMSEGLVGPGNASRLLRRLPDECDSATKVKLGRLAGQDEKPEIIAVPLRTASDFRSTARAVICLPHAQGNWLELPIEEIYTPVDEISLVVVEHGISVTVNSNNPSVFSVEDHTRLIHEPPKRGHRLTEASFAIRASFFDPECPASPDAIRQIERHFVRRRS